jgi:S1-C subfamily serine protease
LNELGTWLEEATVVSRGEASFKMISRKQLEEIAATVGGVPIFGCLPRSSAEQAGVRYGDIVLSVNGTRTHDLDEYLAARSLREDGVSLNILRDGRELSLYVEFRRSEENLEVFAGKIAEGRYLGKSDVPEPDTKRQPS